MAATGGSLKKELSVLDVYAIAMGTTLSSGFFLLPGLAYAEAGPAMIGSYLIAAALVIPALLSMVELATAMPKAGGAYYFLDRSMGPLVGTVGGLGTWLVLILKSAFALIGLGAYLGLLFPNVQVVPVALGMALFFGLLNLWGAKKTGALQIVLVLGLVGILIVFMVIGLFEVPGDLLPQVFAGDSGSMFATAGLVYISYAGLTKVTSVAEEVRDPERNIALGMFLALLTAIVVYGVGTLVLVGTVPATELSGSTTSVADSARYLVGDWGVVAIAIAAILGFFAAANAGILSASRYPLAMGRDHLMPGIMRRLSARGTPTVAVVITVGLIALVLATLDPLKIAKLAGTFQLVIFALLCAAVIVMRESRIGSYDPGFRTPFYPWVQVAGVISSLWIITLMGVLSITFSTGLLVAGVAWYRFYAMKRVDRGGAVYHWFARLGERRYGGLDRELRGILKEKGLRVADPFDQIVARAHVLEAGEGYTFERAVRDAAEDLAGEVGRPADWIEQAFLEGTRVGATPVTHHVALPHFRIDGLERPSLVIVRSIDGIHVIANDPLLDHVEEQDVYAIFFLISAEDDPGLHLRVLAQIAGRVDDEAFMDEWLEAADAQELKEVLLRDEHFLSLTVRPSDVPGSMEGKALHDLNLPEGTLVALIRRRGDVVVPRGNTVLEASDRLTVIGDPPGLAAILKRLRRKRATK